MKTVHYLILCSAIFSCAASAAGAPFTEKDCNRKNLYNEEMDWGIPSPQAPKTGQQDWLPTPIKVDGLERITSCQLEKMLAGAHPPLPVFTQPLFPSVKDGKALRLVPSSIWVPNAGTAPFNANILYAYAQKIAVKAGGTDNRPLVIYSRSALNWESINLALSLKGLGFKKLYWYRGGQDSWNNALPARQTVEILPIDVYNEYLDPKALSSAQ